jgi:hypothetical protein
MSVRSPGAGPSTHTASSGPDQVATVQRPERVQQAGVPRTGDTPASNEQPLCHVGRAGKTATAWPTPGRGPRWLNLLPSRISRRRRRAMFRHRSWSSRRSWPPVRSQSRRGREGCAPLPAAANRIGSGRRWTRVAERSGGPPPARRPRRPEDRKRGCRAIGVPDGRFREQCAGDVTSPGPVARDLRTAMRRRASPTAQSARSDSSPRRE